MPSATRWCPTPEQVMTLEEIFKRGVTTPKPLQVQRITSYLSSYGKIQGKNVFYWFQNRKATERQKLRKKQQELVQYFKHYDHSTADAAAFMTTVQSRQCSSSKQEGQQEVPTHELSKTWKEYVPEKWIRLDCGNSTTDKTIDSPSTTRTTPPKTLELFPTKSMYSLRDECMPLQN